MRRDAFKRAFDVVAALCGLIVLLPLLVLIALAVFLEDRRAPWFRGVRVGRGGRRFRMIKFRTMIPDAWKSGVSSTAVGDRRITRVGKVLRRAKLDELPQLWNVFIGDMSLVGPRPQVEPDAALYTAEEQHLLDLRPGVTDLASLVFADEGEILAGARDPDLLYNQSIRPWKSRLGLLYIERRTLAGDLKILFLTFVAAISRRRALARSGANAGFLGRRSSASQDGRAGRTSAGVAAAGGRARCVGICRRVRRGGRSMKKVFLRNRRVIAEVMQAMIAAASLGISFVLRFDTTLPQTYRHMLFESLPLLVAVKIVVFRAFGLRDVAWRDIGFSDLMRIAAANAAASGLAAVALRLAIGPAFPRSLYLLDFFVCLTLLVAVRAAVKLLLDRDPMEPAKSARRVLIYGAGKTGVATLAEIRAHASIGCEVVGFLDDDSSKQSMRAHGVRVLGGRLELPAVVRKHCVEEILLALPAASGDQLTGILEQCRCAAVSVKRVPALLERIGPRVLVKQIREVRLEDLLGRPRTRWEDDDLQEHLSGRVVLVTGAGGSIGSELCRQIARHRPKALIGFDQAESRAVSDRAGTAGAVSGARFLSRGRQHPEPAAPRGAVSGASTAVGVSRGCV